MKNKKIEPISRIIPPKANNLTVENILYLTRINKPTKEKYIIFLSQFFFFIIKDKKNIIWPETDIGITSTNCAILYLIIGLN